MLTILETCINSEINLVIQGNGEQQLLDNDFNIEPSEVLVNGVKDYSCSKTCNLIGDKNNITLKFNTQIKSCNRMFSWSINITEIDLSNFDASNVTDMGYMFHYCSNLEKIEFGNINTSSLINMGSMFYDCNKLKSVDFSKFDASRVKDMSYLFFECFNVNKIKFGNINTSSVINMQSLFAGCHSLISIDLSKFDTSKVEKMESMFSRNKNLKYLDLSNFDTSKVQSIKYMFKECSSLVYLNLRSFILNNEVNGYNAFERISLNVKYCIEDNKTKNFLKRDSDCSNDCFKENIKIYIDIDNKTCIIPCGENWYNYKYKEKCYTECPNGTYYKYCDNINCNDNIIECFDETPEGYYLDSNDITYRKCYENCLFCYGEGNETINNCKECITNFTLINSTNCYKECEYYYYFDELDKYQCTSSYNCPDKYIKLIEEQNRCIDKCKNDNIYKYEYDNNCFISYPNDTYLLIRDENNFCFNNTPEGYYLDIEKKMYKKCYETCKECYGEGNETINNCIECISNFAFYNNSMNISNCYEKCDNYYYFDENNIFHCSETCPEQYKKKIEEQNRCISNCENDNIYKFEYDNKCYISCRNGTYYNISNIYKCQKVNETKISSVVVNPLFSGNIKMTDIIANDEIDEKDEDMHNFRKNVYDYNISENKGDKVEVKNGVVYQVTTSNNQKNNTNRNISTLNLGDCERELKIRYGIEQIIILLIH